MPSKKAGSKQQKGSEQAGPSSSMTDKGGNLVKDALTDVKRGPRILLKKPGENEPVVYHHDIFDDLATIGSHAGRYKYLPQQGIDPKDVTCYHAWQENWGPDGEDRPQILKLWKHPGVGKYPKYPVKAMKFGTATVLDWEGRPILDFRNLPNTISSNVEGWRMEAWMRQDLRITVHDIVARLRTQPKSDGFVEPIHDRRRLASKTSHFRENAGLLSWTAHGVVEQSQKAIFLESLRTPYQKANNLAVCRDLLTTEKYSCKVLSSGTRSYGKVGAAREKWTEMLERENNREATDAEIAQKEADFAAAAAATYHVNENGIGLEEEYLFWGVTDFSNFSSEEGATYVLWGAAGTPNVGLDEDQEFGEDDDEKEDADYDQYKKDDDDDNEEEYLNKEAQGGKKSK